MISINTQSKSRAFRTSNKNTGTSLQTSLTPSTSPELTTDMYSTSFLKFLEVSCTSEEHAPLIVDELKKMSKTHVFSAFFADVFNTAMHTVNQLKEKNSITM